MLKTIDVTLRDGGYKTNFHFPESFIAQHVSCIDAAGINWIEIGYRNGSNKPFQNAGDVAYSPTHYIKGIRKAAPNAKLVVIGHPKNLEREDIDDLVDAGVGMLRICFSEASFDKASDLISYARQAGLVVCANLTRSNSLRLHKFLDLSRQASLAGANVIYIADSNGSMQPSRVEVFVRSILDETECEVGFHAHDHMGLAMSNSLAAVAAGATYVDASLNGIGKGAGNLRLEAWMSWLVKQGQSQCDMDAILMQLPLLNRVVNCGGNREEWLGIIMAFHDLSMDDRAAFLEEASDVSQDITTARKLAVPRA